MFEREITLNQFLLKSMDDVVADIPADRIYDRSPGNGHPPVWVLGHLAICGELGEKFSGGDICHPQWLPQFGPGSPDDVEDNGHYSKAEIVSAIHETYARFESLAKNLKPESLDVPHGVELLEGSAIQTAGDLIAHLLSSHFGFHLAQLSAWRRAEGFKALF